jgi:hypothetical protein
MMRRYIATVEYAAGEYWISFPGIEKAGSRAARPEDIIPHARRTPPASIWSSTTDGADHG